MTNFTLETAQRQRARLKLAITGAAGSGKTLSALRLAHGLMPDWEKICVIDTEQRSSGLYVAHKLGQNFSIGQFQTVPFSPPYDPRRYVEALRFAESQKMDVIIIDSASHEWEGAGGCLELHTRAGGQFQHWKVITPLHRAFIDAILASPSHVICTLRAKADYQMDKNDQGRARVEKIGLKPTQREGFDYEVSIEFRLNESHLATVSKDRTGLFADEIPFLITEQTGMKLRQWNDAGIDAPEPKRVAASVDPQTQGKPANSVPKPLMTTAGKPGLASDKQWAMLYAVGKKAGLNGDELHKVIGDRDSLTWDKVGNIKAQLEKMAQGASNANG